MERVRYALIGFGGIAENRIAKEGFCIDRARFHDHPSAELVGVTDTNQRRKDAALALGLRWFDSAEDALANGDVEAAYVATNNAGHAEMAIQALKAGKHCLIEKPMATTLEEAVRIRQAAQENGKSVLVDHMMEKNSFNVLARAQISSGSIGEVNDINLHMEFMYGATPEEAATWRCSNPSELGGPIGDVGSHCLYMAEFLLGKKVRQIRCAYLPRTMDIAVENGAFIHLQFDDNTVGTVRAAFNQPRGGLLGNLSNFGYEVYGSAGVLRGYATLFQISGHPDEPVAIRLVRETSKGVEDLKPDRVRNIYEAQIDEHARSIRNNSPHFAEEGVRNLSMILACHESAQNGCKAMPIE